MRGNLSSHVLLLFAPRIKRAENVLRVLFRNVDARRMFKSHKKGVGVDFAYGKPVLAEQKIDAAIVEFEDLRDSDGERGGLFIDGIGFGTPAAGEVGTEI